MKNFFALALLFLFSISGSKSEHGVYDCTEASVVLLDSTNHGPLAWDLGGRSVSQLIGKDPTVGYNILFARKDAGGGLHNIILYNNTDICMQGHGTDIVVNFGTCDDTNIFQTFYINSAGGSGWFSIESGLYYGNVCQDGTNMLGEPVLKLKDEIGDDCYFKEACYYP